MIEMTDSGSSKPFDQERLIADSGERDGVPTVDVRQNGFERKCKYLLEE